MGHLIIPGDANSGIILCQPEHDVPDESTLIIEGIARGGTSMVSSMVSSAGYYMDGYAPAWESHRWKHCFNYGGDVAKMIEEYNSLGSRWGFKHPGLMFAMLDRWETFLGQLRNPRVIIVFRDPVAVDCRSYLAMRQHSIEVAIVQMQALTHWAIGTEVPVMMVSYEKMIQASSETATHFNRFVGAEADWSLVSPNNAQYIEMMGTARTCA